MKRALARPSAALAAIPLIIAVGLAWRWCADYGRCAVRLAHSQIEGTRCGCGRPMLTKCYLWELPVDNICANDEALGKGAMHFLDCSIGR
jgi:hypothetical protein